MGIGLLALRQGDLPRALPRLEQAVGLCQDADLPFYFPLIASPLDSFGLGRGAYSGRARRRRPSACSTQGDRTDHSNGMVYFQTLVVFPWARRRR